jgi:hypothetical protein
LEEDVLVLTVMVSISVGAVAVNMASNRWNSASRHIDWCVMEGTRRFTTDVTAARMTLESFGAAFPERAQKLAWFFGAGTSAASGIPTGYDMILDFKTRLFCAATKLPRREVDPTDPIWKERIETYFDDAHGLPARGSPSEYAAAFETVHPTVEGRRSYIDNAVRLGTPTYGHRVFAALACGRRVPCVFTTNFDPLIENSIIAADDLLAAEERVHATVAALDSADRADRCLRDNDWPLVAKLHGDYQSDWLMNTERELEQDTQLRQALIKICGRFGLAVVGYSGRDASVMDALLAAARQSGGMPAGLFWFARPRAELLPAVTNLLEEASERTSAFIVEVENFDELAGELDRQIQHRPVLETHVRSSRVEPLLRPVALPTQEAQRFPVLRTSALLVTALPVRARKLELAQPSTTPAVQGLLREARAQASAACQGAMVAAFGRDADLMAALNPLGARVDGEIDLVPGVDSWALGLLYEVLVRVLSHGRPLRPVLRHRGHSLVLTPPARGRSDPAARADRRALQPVQQAYAERISGVVPNVGYPFAEAARVRLERWLDQWWVVFDPYTWVELPRSGPKDNDQGPPVDRDHLADWRRERWARRYNAKWANIIDAWATLLAPEPGTTVRASGLGPAEGIDATFGLYQKTAWSSPGQAAPEAAFEGRR